MCGRGTIEVEKLEEPTDAERPEQPAAQRNEGGEQ